MFNQNAEARRKGYTKKRYKGLDQPPHYVSPTLTSNLGRDYALKAHQRVSLRTISGRIVVPYAGDAKQTARLWYDRGKKRFYLLVALTLEMPDPAADAYQQVVGLTWASDIWPP